MTLFLTIPVAVAYVALARPLAAAVSLGKMAAGGGTLLVAACLAGIGPGVLADGGFSVGAQAFYAKHDARSPLVSMIVRVAISLGGMLLSVLLLGGVGVLVGLGLSITVGDFVGAWHLAHRLRGRLSEGHARLRPSVVRSALASLLMIGPSYAVVRVLSAHHAPGRAIVGALAAAVGAAVYFAVQAAFRAPELPSLRSGVKLLLPWARGIPRPEGLE
jgi:putative peptidoglycan lipid II flippase